MRKTPKDVIFFGRIPITFDVELVIVVRLGNGVECVALRVAIGRLRIERRVKQVCRYRVNHRHRDDIVFKRNPRTGDKVSCGTGTAYEITAGIVKLVRNGTFGPVQADARGIKTTGTEGPKIPLALRCGEHIKELRVRWVIETLPLVIEKEEHLVLDDWSTNGAAIHIPAKGYSRRSSEIVFPAVGVQLVIAEVLPYIAMKIVSARLDRGADDATLEITELGRGIVSDQIEFLDGVGRRGVTEQVVGNLIVVQTVENEIVGLLAVTVNIRPCAVRRVVTIVKVRRIRGNRTCRQQTQLNVVTCGQRQPIGGGRINNCADLSGIGL